MPQHITIVFVDTVSHCFKQQFQMDEMVLVQKHTFIKWYQLALHLISKFICFAVLSII